MSLLDVLDARYRPIHLLPFLLTTLINLLFLACAQIVVDLLCDLEFEIDGDMGTGTGRLDRIGSGIIAVCRHVRQLLLFPPCDNNIAKTGIPGISAISLSRSQLSLIGLTKPQVRLDRLGTRTAMVMKPCTNPLTRDMNNHEFNVRSVEPSNTHIIIFRSESQDGVLIGTVLVDRLGAWDDRPCLVPTSVDVRPEAV